MFQTYQWHRSWWQAYGDRYEPSFVTVSHGDQTTGVAALYADHTAKGTRLLRFVGDGRADYCDLLAADDVNTVAAMVRGLRDQVEWDVIELRNIPSLSPSVGMLQSQCRAAGLHVIIRDQFVCPTLCVRGHEPAVHRLIEKPSLRRRQNYFERAGRLTIRDLTSASEIAPYLDAFFDQHTARWSRTSTPSLFQDAANRAFYRDLTVRLDGTQWLLFSLIEFNGEPIAFHYGFDYNDVLLWYKPSFDPAFAGRSPGLVLVRHLLRRVLHESRRELDFTIGDEPFKRRFTNVMRKTVNVQIFRRPSLYYVERSLRATFASLRRILTGGRTR